MGDQHPDYSLLDVSYDKDHRGHYLSDQEVQEFLTPLRLRTHSVHRWDERYAPYIRRAGFLELVRTYLTKLPTLDPALLSAAVDRYQLILLVRTIDFLTTIMLHQLDCIWLSLVSFF